MAKFIETLKTDKWSGVYCQESEIANPSDEIIIQSVLALDANEKTIVTLIGADGGNLTAGGGNGNYVVCVTTSEGNYWNLVNCDHFVAESNGFMLLKVGGQEGDFPMRQVIERPQLIRAINFFADSGQLDPSLCWEKD